MISRSLQPQHLTLIQGALLLTVHTVSLVAASAGELWYYTVHIYISWTTM